ncbi:MAG: hypothetical protein WCI88_05115 [Chloroflexota bacterium]
MTPHNYDTLLEKSVLPQLLQTTNTLGLVKCKLEKFDIEWSRYLSALHEMTSFGLSTNEVLNRLHHLQNRYEGFIEWLNTVINCDFRKFAGQTSPNRLVAENSRYASVVNAQDYSAMFDMIENCIDSNCDGVVEFGSGLGNNLARLRLRLPAMTGLTYIAYEPSASGRIATELLFANDKNAHIRVLPFDYTNPSLDFLSSFRRLVAFTCHSIEQVTVLGANFYQLLLDSPIVSCVHLEPFGWQRYTNLSDEVCTLYQDEAARKSFLDNYIYTVDDANFSANSAAWSVLCAYNTDLLQLVSSASDRGDIGISAIQYDLIGNNPFNPSSIIAWNRKRRRRRSKS